MGTESVTQMQAAAVPDFTPRAGVTPILVPFLTAFRDLAALWQQYDVGDPQTNRPAFRELEAVHGAAWRIREGNGATRWSYISIFAAEVIRRAGVLWG